VSENATTSKGVMALCYYLSAYDCCHSSRFCKWLPYF